MEKAENQKEGQVQKARQYQRFRYWLFLVNYLYSALFLVAFLFSGASLNLKMLVLRPQIYLTNALYLLAFLVIMTVAFLPLSFFRGYVMEHLFGLSNQTLFAWLWDEVKGFLVSTIITVPLGVGAYLLLAEFQEFWWLYAAILWSAVSFILIYIAPVVISPLFNKFEPVKEESLRQQILSLAEKAGLKIRDVLRTDMSRQTKKANAYFTGIGNTKRIVLGDTLLDNYTQEEISSVVAHEMGHWKMGHLWKGTLLNIFGSLVGFYLADQVLRASFAYFRLSEIADIAGLPLMVLTFMGLAFLGTPAMNSLSRYFEHQADLFELRLAQNPEATISTFKKLAQQNLSDPSPSPIIEFLLYSHPSISKRIKLAEEYLQKT